MAKTAKMWYFSKCKQVDRVPRNRFSSNLHCVFGASRSGLFVFFQLAACSAKSKQTSNRHAWRRIPRLSSPENCAFSAGMVQFPRNDFFWGVMSIWCFQNFGLASCASTGRIENCVSWGRECEFGLFCRTDNGVVFLAFVKQKKWKRESVEVRPLLISLRRSEYRKQTELCQRNGR